MKFFHLSDLHIGKLLCEYSMLEDQRYWCGQVLDFLREQPHDAVVISGDLYDRAVPPADAVALLDSFLTMLTSELGLPVLAVSGNHDSGPRLGFGNSLYRLGGLYLAATPKAQIERVTLCDAEGEVDFWLLPYLTPADVRNLLPGCHVASYQQAYAELLRQGRKGWNGNRRNVLVAHGFFSRLSAQGDMLEAITGDSEISIGGMDIVDASLFDEFDYCAFGHLHTPQQVGCANMRYSGSPLCYSVGEEHRRKALLSVTLDGRGVVECEETRLVPLRRVFSVSGTLEQLSAATGGQQVCDDYVFVNLADAQGELCVAERIRMLYPNYLGIRYIMPEQQPALGAAEQLRRQPLAEAFAVFFDSVMGRPLNECETELVEQAAADKEDRP